MGSPESYTVMVITILDNLKIKWKMDLAYLWTPIEVNIPVIGRIINVMDMVSKYSNMEPFIEDNGKMISSWVEAKWLWESIKHDMKNQK